MLIDSDGDDRELFTEALSQIDKTIDCVLTKDGKTALEALAAPEAMLPQLIFVEVHIPGITGIEVLATIKSTARLQAIPTIVYATSFAPLTGKQICERGAADCILKPCSFEGIVGQLRNVIASYQARILA